MFKILAAILLFAATGECASTVVVRSTETTCNQLSCRKIVGYGSGVVIGKFQDGSDAVLTCAHNLGRGSTDIAWTGGEWVPAKIVIAQLHGRLPSDKFDAALLSAYLPGAECGVLSDRAVDSIGVLTGHVHGRNPPWRNARGRYVHDKRTLVGVVSVLGESGGPVVDEQTGEILGIQWGTDRATESYMTTSVEIKAWIIGKLGYLPQCQRSAPVPPPQIAKPDCAAPQVPPSLPQPTKPAVCSCGCKSGERCGKDSEIIEKVKLLRIPVVVTVKKTDCNKETRIYRVYLVPKISGDNVVIMAEVYDTKNTESTSDDVLLNDKQYDVLGGKEVRLTITGEDGE